MNSEETPQKPARKRGAQPGNRNAYKHGFYSNQFSNQDIASLKDVQKGLVDEILMLRLLMRKVLEQVDEQESSFEQWMGTLQRLSLVANRLAKLVKTHQELTGDVSGGGEDVFEEIHKMMVEKGWGK